MTLFFYVKEQARSCPERLAPSEVEERRGSGDPLDDQDFRGRIRAPLSYFPYAKIT